MQANNIPVGFHAQKMGSPGRKQGPLSQGGLGVNSKGLGAGADFLQSLMALLGEMNQGNGPTSTFLEMVGGDASEGDGPGGQLLADGLNVGNRLIGMGVPGDSTGTQSMLATPLPGDGNGFSGTAGFSGSPVGGNWGIGDQSATSEAATRTPQVPMAQAGQMSRGNGLIDPLLQMGRGQGDGSANSLFEAGPGDRAGSGGTVTVGGLGNSEMSLGAGLWALSGTAGFPSADGAVNTFGKAGRAGMVSPDATGTITSATVAGAANAANVLSTANTEEASADLFKGYGRDAGDQTPDAKTGAYTRIFNPITTVTAAAATNETIQAQAAMPHNLAYANTMRQEAATNDVMTAQMNADTDALTDKIAPLQAKDSLMTFDDGKNAQSKQDLFSNAIGSDNPDNIGGTNSTIFSTNNLGTTGTDSIRVVNLMEEVARQVQIMQQKGDGTAKLQLKLEPEHLGEVTVKLSFSQGKLSAQFIAASHLARDAIDQALAQLKENLAQHNIQLDEASVSTGEKETPQFQEKGSAFNQKGFSSKDQPAAYGEPSTDDEKTATGSQTGLMSKVNYLV